MSHGLVGYGVRLLFVTVASEDREFEPLWDSRPPMYFSHQLLSQEVLFEQTKSSHN